jgi:hypothetical protein
MAIKLISYQPSWLPNRTMFRVEHSYLFGIIKYTRDYLSSPDLMCGGTLGWSLLPDEIIIPDKLNLQLSFWFRNIPLFAKKKLHKS